MICHGISGVFVSGRMRATIDFRARHEALKAILQAVYSVTE